MAAEGSGWQVRAASRAVWGTEEYHGLLRAAVHQELIDHQQFYCGAPEDRCSEGNTECLLLSGVLVAVWNVGCCGW